MSNCAADQFSPTSLGGRSLHPWKQHRDELEDKQVDYMDESDNEASHDEDEDPCATDVLPKTCPGMDCEDVVPDNMSNQLKTALSTYVSLVKQKKSSSRLAMDICILIKQEQRRLSAIKVADEMNWPATCINFNEIPNRVLQRYNELQTIMFTKEARENLFLWNCFKADLEFEPYSLEQFARMRHVPVTSIIWRNSRSG